MYVCVYIYIILVGKWKDVEGKPGYTLCINTITTVKTKQIKNNKKIKQIKK